MNFQAPYYNMNPAFYSFPVQPMPVPCQGFVPSPAMQLQYSQSSRCAEPSKPLARKRTHICPVRTCGKCFTTSGNLSRHKRLHGKIDPLTCPMDGCICVFPSTNKLERHLKFHYGGDVKVCHVEACGRTFSTTGNLNRHMKKHHGGVAPPSADAPATTTPTQKDNSKANTQSWSPCASTSDESDTDSDASIEPWWSSPSVAGSAAASLDCVWNEDLLDTLAAMLDDIVEPQVKQEQGELC